METLVNASLLEVITVLSDVEQFKKWVSVITHSQVLHEVSLLRKLTCLKAELPKPFSNRQLVVQASGHIIEDECAVVVAMSSISVGSQWLNNYQIPLSLAGKNQVMVDVKGSHAHIQPLTPNKTLVRMLFSGDPKLDYVPQTLINWAIKSIV